MPDSVKFGCVQSGHRPRGSGRHLIRSARNAEKTVRGVRRRSKAYCTNYNKRFVVTKGVGYRKFNEFPFAVGIVAPQTGDAGTYIYNTGHLWQFMQNFSFSTSAYRGMVAPGIP